MMASLSFNMGGTWTCHVDCLWPLALTSDQPMIPLFCMQWSLRAYPKESEGAGGRFYIGQTTLGALAVTWPLKNLRVDQVTVCQCVCVDTSRKTYPHMKLYHRQNRVDPLQSWRCTIPLLTDEQNDPSEIFWVERLVTTRRHLAREDQPLAEIAQLFFNSVVHRSLALQWPGKLLMINPTISFKFKMVESDVDADDREKYWLLRFTVRSLSVTKLWLWRFSNTARLLVFENLNCD